MDDAFFMLTLWFLLVAPLRHKVALSASLLALPVPKSGRYQSPV